MAAHLTQEQRNAVHAKAVAWREQEPGLSLRAMAERLRGEGFDVSHNAVRDALKSAGVSRKPSKPTAQAPPGNSVEPRPTGPESPPAEPLDTSDTLPMTRGLVARAVRQAEDPGVPAQVRQTAWETALSLTKRLLDIEADRRTA